LQRFRSQRERGSLPGKPKLGRRQCGRATELHGQVMKQVTKAPSDPPAAVNTGEQLVSVRHRRANSCGSRGYLSGIGVHLLTLETGDPLPICCPGWN
jgi:hypothetical protein